MIGFLSSDSSTWVNIVEREVIHHREDIVGNSELLFLDIIGSTQFLKSDPFNAWVLQAFWKDIEFITHGKIKGDGGWLSIEKLTSSTKQLIQEVADRYELGVRIQKGGDDGEIIDEIQGSAKKKKSASRKKRILSLEARSGENYIIIGKGISELTKGKSLLEEVVTYAGQKIDVSIIQDVQLVSKIWQKKQSDSGLSMVYGTWSETSSGGLIGEGVHLGFRLYAAAIKNHQNLSIRCDVQGKMYTDIVRDISEKILWFDPSELRIPNQSFAPTLSI
jgi:hypothetical protein